MSSTPLPSHNAALLPRLLHQELGMKILERVQADTAEIAVVEQQAKREGRQLLMVLSPKKK